VASAWGPATVRGRGCFGASIHTGKYDPANDLSVTFFGVDAAFQKSGLEVRCEFVQAKQDATAGDLTKTGFFAQVAYLATSTIEPAIRFSQMEFPGASNRDVREISLGVSVYPSDFAALRVFGRINKERSVPEVDDNLLTVQFTVGF